MSLPPRLPPALRGAVDLSSLGRPAPTSSAPGRSGTGSGLVIEVTDASIEDALRTTMDVPALLVLWDASAAATKGALDAAVTAAEATGGRLRVLSVEVRSAPRVAAAFQVQQVPVTLAVLGGQPVPLFAGVLPQAEMAPVVDQVLQLAAQNGLTGRVDLSATTEASAQEEPPLPPLHQKAYDAIEAGDLDGAIAALEQALKENPADADALAGLAQTKLLRRTQGVDLAQARAAAAVAPTDVDAQTLVADLDVLGGHVEDAFDRMIDLVRATTDADRNAARTHLLELFEVVGTADERVTKARRALMSALF